MRKYYISPSQAHFNNYYLSQATQVGYGDLPGYNGFPYQRGQGLGSFFRGLFRMAMPLFKTVAPILGKRALSTTANIANDLIEGGDIVPTLKKRGRQLAGDVMIDVGNRVQSGSGAVRRKRKQKTIKAPYSHTPTRRTPNRQTPKRQKRDYFSNYD